MAYNVAPNTSDNLAAMLPIGSIFLWPSAIVPNGFLSCNGGAVSRASLASLFSIIGTTYGAGDGSSTFNLPNTASRVVRGSGAGFPLATSAGADAITIAAVNLPNHSHSLTDPGHFHQQRAGGNINIISSGSTPVQGNVDNVGSANTFSAVTGITMTDSLLVGGSQVTQVPVSVINPYVALNYIIRST